jgi:hypothetical protein
VALHDIVNRRFRILIGLTLIRYKEAHGRNQKGQVIDSVGWYIDAGQSSVHFKIQHQRQLVPIAQAQIRLAIDHILRDMIDFKDKGYRAIIKMDKPIILRS